ncbi:hypothetical protein Tco_0053770 [Tanacetum coccineum]
MEASTSTPGGESTEKVEKEYTESDFENKPKSKRQKQLPRYDCKKQFNQKMVVNEEWLAGNDEYIERKVLKELKLKRKREEKKSPGRWTRGDEAKDLAEKHKKIKKNSSKIQKVQEKLRIKEKKE